MDRLLTLHGFRPQTTTQTWITMTINPHHFCSAELDDLSLQITTHWHYGGRAELQNYLDNYVTCVTCCTCTKHLYREAKRLFHISRSTSYTFAERKAQVIGKGNLCDWEGSGLICCSTLSWETTGSTTRP
jgi:hypothetical protein